MGGRSLGIVTVMIKIIDETRDVVTTGIREGRTIETETDAGRTTARTNIDAEKKRSVGDESEIATTEIAIANAREGMRGVEMAIGVLYMATATVGGSM